MFYKLPPQIQTIEGALQYKIAPLTPQDSKLLAMLYSDVSIKNFNILPNRQYIANTADSAQEQYS